MTTDNRTKTVLVATAQAGLALGGHSPLGLALKAASFAVGALHERRVSKMWEHAVSGIDEPIEFTNRVEQALLEDGSAIGFGFVAAARAAMDAFAPSTIPTIGLLARSFLTRSDPTRREYRDILAVLAIVDDAEFDRIRRAIHILRPFVEYSEDTFITTLWRDQAQGNMWRWFSPTAPDRDIAQGDEAVLLVQAIEPLASEPTMRKSGPRFRRGMIELLAEIMPLEPFEPFQPGPDL